MRWSLAGSSNSLVNWVKLPSLRAASLPPERPQKYQATGNTAMNTSTSAYLAFAVFTSHLASTLATI